MRERYRGEIGCEHGDGEKCAAHGQPHTKIFVGSFGMLTPEQIAG
jgi:hypothetical protein